MVKNMMNKALSMKQFDEIVSISEPRLVPIGLDEYGMFYDAVVDVVIKPIRSVEFITLKTTVLPTKGI